MREIWTDHIKTLPDKRTTRDIDFAIYINEHEQYDKLKRHLVEKAGFKEHKEPYRLLTPDNNIVDLIPFGGIEQNGEVLQRNHLPNYIFSKKDRILVLGQDVLVANTTKYAKRIPILAINPDPEHYDGILLPFYIDNFEPGLRKVPDGNNSIATATMAETTLCDGQTYGI